VAGVSSKAEPNTTVLKPITVPPIAEFTKIMDTNEVLMENHLFQILVIIAVMNIISAMNFTSPTENFAL